MEEVTLFPEKYFQNWIDSIQEYCRTNTLNPTDLQKNRIKFVEKQQISDNESKLDNANLTDFNFLVSYRNEKTHSIKRIF